MQEYDVNLMSVPGPHFLITAKQRGDFHGCPSAIVFASVKGMKYEVTVSKDIIAKFPIHHLGTAQLHSIVNAEQLAEPIDVDEFNLPTTVSTLLEKFHVPLVLPRPTSWPLSSLNTP